MIDIENDFEFRRIDFLGLNLFEIKKLVFEKYILVLDKKKGEIIIEEDLKKVNIVVIIVCCLKFLCLKRKVLLKIGIFFLIEMCIKNVLKFEDINLVVLVILIIEEDLILKNYIYNKLVIFY